MRFKEIEHKFVVDDAFDLRGFTQTLERLEPTRHTALVVRDRYFITESGQSRRFVLRHRFDSEINQLTIKSVEGDPEVRDEISLNLGHHAGAQDAEVDAFVARQGVLWSGTLEKDLRVWYFPDCEVVHYTATADGRVVRVVEFEATAKVSLSQALEILHRYESATGFDASTRSMESLVNLLFPGVFPPI
ncbi:MAG: hypothetical protein U0Q11_04030 [Vicinamibacterales bacterium]